LVGGAPKGIAVIADHPCVGERTASPETPVDEPDDEERNVRVLKSLVESA
jgi:hypothetical protein